MIRYNFFRRRAALVCLILFFILNISEGQIENKSYYKTTEMKGFVLSDLIIPLNEIHDGGPPKDGIPSIDEPKFLSINEVGFMADDELVLALKYKGISKAYPIKILDHHEVVNDIFGQHPIAITYCPLCGSGVAINAKIGDSIVNFGVSGLLYNSDVLLYDRLSESLWSQIKGEAISGSFSGTKFDEIPMELVSWGEWKQRHPETVLLSKNTGFRRYYEQKVYSGYDRNSQLYFPVSASDKRLHKKEKVIGIQIGEEFKAYSFEYLSSVPIPLEDVFNGKKLKIYYNPEVNTSRIEDENGNLLNGQTMYWFAWYTFHPQTELLH